MKKFTSFAVAIDFLLKHQANSFRYILEMESSRKGFQQLGVLQTTLANSVMQEESVVSESPTTENLKMEPLSTSLLINDNDGNKELVRNSIYICLVF